MSVDDSLLRLDARCRGLPEVFLGVSWGDRPTYLVRQRPTDQKGRGFVLFRAPHRTAIDPATGLEYDDLIVIRTPSADDKAALVQSAGPFFTIDHFRNDNAVLIQAARLGEVDDTELAEIVADAWRAVAPKSLIKRWESGAIEVP